MSRELPEDTPARHGSWGDASLPASVVGGLVGMLAGTLPATLWHLIFRSSFSPMYIFLPLLIYYGMRLFRGYGGRRGLVVLGVFSVLGFYLKLLSGPAAAFVLKYQMLFLNIPLVTVTLIGQRGVLTGPAFSSAYAFPFVFTLTGIFLSAELLLYRRVPPTAPEPDAEDAA